VKDNLFFIKLLNKLKRKNKPETEDLYKAEDNTEKKPKVKWSKRKKIAAIVILIAAIAVIAGVVLFFIFRRNGSQGLFNRGGMGNGGFAISGDMIAASGVISVGVTEESFDVENLTTDLIIEEIYVSSNEDIEEGTKILKLTDDSVAEAREELEKTLKDAELAYRAGSIEYEQNKITAQYDYQSALLAGEQASEVYQETVSGLKSSVDKAEDELADAQEKIAEYQSYVNDDSYKSYFKVDEYQAIYDENLKVLTDKMEEWGVSWEQVTGGGMGSGGMGSGGMGSGGSYSYTSILSSLYQVLEQNEKDLEQAKSDYEDAVTNAAFELQTYELKLPSLEQAVTEAKENYEIQAGQAKLTYETSLANAERAESDYETALEKAEADYETLKDDYEDARDNLELFESSVGDGYFYASGNGTILRVMVRAEQKLSGESTVFMYSNPDVMSVTVSVDQTDIAKLSVGDDAYVMSTSGDGYEGSIQSISPITSSESRTNVTYSVTVTLSGDTSSLKANQTVTVIFGITADEVERMLNQTETMQTPDGQQTPNEGGQTPQAPDGQQNPGEESQTPQAPDGQQAPNEGGQAPQAPNGAGKGVAE
jgi:multidrug resistance efflux pump